MKVTLDSSGLLLSRLKLLNRIHKSRDKSIVGTSASSHLEKNPLEEVELPVPGVSDCCCCCCCCCCGSDGRMESAERALPIDMAEDVDNEENKESLRESGKGSFLVRIRDRQGVRLFIENEA